MGVKIGKGLLSQIEKSFESSNNKITLDDLVKFIKEMDEQYNHLVNTRREYYAQLLCKDGKVRSVKVVENKKESEEWGPRFCYYIETDNGIIPASYEDIIYKFKIIQIMTLKEAKKILNKEGFHMALAKEVVNQTGAMREFEKPEVCEAIKVANANRWTVALSPTEWDEREARLKKEYEKNTKAPGSGVEQPEEKIRIICCSASPKADFYYKHVLNEGNPALKESASQFNDALLGEQAKKIKSLGKEIARLNKIIHEKKKVCCELVAENTDLKERLTDKDAVLSDVAEELRLTKIREKNLAELGLKYVVENEKLKKKLANKIVDKIDAQALKSAESALAYKEKVIAEKDEVIADLDKELAAQKGLKDEISLKYIGVKRILKLRRDECEKLKKELEAFKESYKRRIKEDSEHFEHIQKICNAGLQKWLIESEYLEKDKPFRFPQLPDFSEEEEKKLSLFRDDSVGAVTNQKDCSPVKDTHPAVDIAEEGGDHSGVTVLCGKDFVKKFKENGWFDFSEKKHKEKSEELSKVADEALSSCFDLVKLFIIKSEK